MGRTAAGAEERRATRLALLGVVLLALLPSVGTLTAPWIAEDSGILAQVRADGPWADWGRGQYGLQILRFWRPLVSTSWALQEAWTGIAPLPLRLFNLALHALVAAFVFACARRVGAGLSGAFLAGAWIGLFPEQGGTVTWIAGRTDLLCALFLMACSYVALGRRTSPSAALAFLACTSKEFGFLAPLWVAGLVLARGGSLREVLWRAGPASAGVALAFAWRWLALGGLDGGYPTQVPGLFAAALGTSRALSQAAWPSVLALASLWAAAWWARSASPRGMGWSLGLALASLVPIHALLADGFLEPENRRLLYLAECALALAAGLAWSRPANSVARGRVLGALVLALLGARLALALEDTHDWAGSARYGEEAVARARASVAAAEPAASPVLFTDFESGHDGAYCLGFGLAARFRAPFPASPRPVWPWRPVFSVPGRERSALVEARADGSLWPLDDPLPVVPLAVLGAGETPLVRVVLDERVLLAAEDRSPRLTLRGAPAGAALEGLLISELGYEPLPLGAFDGTGAVTVSLMQLLARSNAVAAGGQILAHAADLGARRAYLELRALGPDGEPLAGSRWIELTWSAELRARAVR
ncbi:MAG: hypothetical protein HOP15_07240 [Planctomycetes bacterium]|nr:hypothetical protein [Planctomycetota bacterium]